MAVNINADTVVGGAVVTADASGQLALQGAGVTQLTVTSTGITLASPLPTAQGGTGTTSSTFVNLATNVTGTLPVAQGGTGNSFFSVSGPASSTKTYTFPNENMSVGYRNIPAVGTQTGSYTLGVGDVGKYVQVGTSGSITIPTSVFSEGDAILIANNTTGSITITCSAPTAYIAGTNTIKTSMTLATRGVANVFFLSSSVCFVTGNVA